ncbi:MAG: hypothetical protein U1E46_18595 [Hyphomicrobiales bacterium]
MGHARHIEERNLTGAELRAARHLLQITQEDLARLLRIGPNGARTIRRYENFYQPVPGPVSVCVEMLIDERREVLSEWE